MVNAFHGRQTKEQGIHGAIAFEYADATARTSAGPFQTYDKDKLATQLDTSEVYILTDPSGPTWELFATLGSGLAAHASTHQSGGSDELDGYDLAFVYSPSNYVTPVSNILGEHIAAIDEALATTGTGDVVGPGSATDNALARYDGTTGTLIQNSNATLSDIGQLTLSLGLSVNGTIDVGGFSITNVNFVDGVDVSDHSSRHEFGGADTIEISNMSTSETDTTLVLKPDGAGSVSWVADQITDLDGYVFEDRQVIAGAGLTGGGDLSADITVNVVANADGSIIVNANDIQVGVLANDSQHGDLGGGTLHELANSIQSGFFSSDGYDKLEGIEAGAQINTVDSVFGRTGDVIAVSGDYDSDQIDNASAIFGASVSDALETLNSLIVGGGSGTVTGPETTTDNAIARWSGTDGYTIQNSGVIIDDSDNVSGIGNITLTGTVDGRDVSVDGAALDNHIVDSSIHFTLQDIGLDGYALDSDLTDHISDTANPHSTSLANLTDTDLTGIAQGNILYRDDTQWVVLAPGTSGQFLQTQGVAANPQWSDAPTSLTAPIDPDEDGYIAIASGGDLTYLRGESDGYVLTWDEVSETWESAPKKKCAIVEFALTEEVNNTVAYFFTWAGHSTGGLRSSANSGLQNANDCSPFLVPFDATIKKAVLRVNGVGVQNGSIVYPVIYQTNLLRVNASSETKILDVDFSISNSFTVGTFSVGATDFTGNTTINIDVDEGQMLGMQFENGSGASVAGQTRMAFITLVLEER